MEINYTFYFFAFLKKMIKKLLTFCYWCNQCAFHDIYVHVHGRGNRNVDTAGIPDPDLLIRTSGEQRLSNYLMWQLAYTEFYFTEVPWPDFHEEELRKAIEQYNNRDRRYGGVKEE